MSLHLTGGQAAANTLRALGVSTIFSVSGNQVLPIYDAAPDAAIRMIHMRHESAAAFAAAGWSELSGQPGVILTSAGPGFLAALTGVSVVRAMELPLLFLSGASPVRNSGFGNFQELDQATTCRSVCKASFSAVSAEAIPLILNKAWALAQDGIPGPVHVGLPADVLLANGPWAEVQPVEPARADASGLQPLADHLSQSSRPILIARPAAARGESGRLLDELAAQLGITPVITGPPRGLADSKYAHLASHYKRSDCALVIGPSDYSLGFLDQSILAQEGKILLIDAEGDPKPRRQPTIHTQGTVLESLRFLVNATKSYRRRDDEWSKLWLSAPPPEPRPERPAGAVHPLEVAAQIREMLSPDDVLCVDGGEFCQWIRLGLRDVSNRWLWNSKFGIIGNSLPMALGVSTHGHKGRTIAIMGDGGAGYHLLEFETAARYGIPFVAIIGNDARWSAEWHIQATRYGLDRTFETNLSPARYDQAASGLGALGFHAGSASELREALKSALAAQKPSCINVNVQSLRSPAVPP